MENNLPRGWVEATVSEYAIISKLKGKEGTIPYLEIGDIDIVSKKYELKDKPSVKGCKSSKKHDVLISRVRPTRGAIAIINEDELCVSSGFSILRFNEEAAAKLVYYQLAFNTKFLNYLGENCTGTMYPTVSEEFIENYKINLSPLAEQHRIVAKLDAIIQKVESNKQRLEKIPKLLKRFRQSVLAAAVSGKLTEDWRNKNDIENIFEISDQFEINETYKELHELPKNWQWIALGNYAKCNRGRFSIRPRNDPRYFGGDIPFIQIGDLPKEGGFVSSHTQTLNEDGLNVSKMFSKNTLVIAIVGATIGNTGILAYDMCFTDSLVGINRGDLDLNLYIDYYLRIEKENFRQLSYAGGGQPNIKLELLNAYPFPLAPLEEQKEIVRRVEQLFAFAHKLETRYIKAKAMMDKLAQSILAKAFRGELVPQNPNDEPASKLLERIKAEKEKLVAGRKGKGAKQYSDQIK
jgi:type I restriction enzyme S subunit